MPRIHQKNAEYAREDFLKEIRMRQGEYGLMSQRALSRETGIGISKLCGLLQEPERFTLADLRKVIDVIHLDPVVVMAMLGYKARDVKRAAEELA